ncbi:MAG: sodium:proton exchanger [Solirubrobacteraceae bacterium]
MAGLTRTERAGLIAVAVLTVVSGVARYVSGTPHILAFVLAGLALGGGAWIVSFATEQVGASLGVAGTGLLQSTLGNLPEFFVVLFALQAGELVIAQTAILGSILVNALLVLGMAIVAGARRRPDGLMRFSPRLPNDTATLLLMASFIIVLVGLAGAVHGPASHHITAISIVGAVLLLAVYGVWTHQFLTTPAPAEPEELERTRLSRGQALGLLIVAGVAAGFVSDWFVHALEPTIHSLHISQAFAGLVIVAIAGNAIEHVVGVVLAARGRSELAISVIKASVGQVAAFLFPVLVLVSLLTSTTLTFALPPEFTGALAATALIMWQITGAGEASAVEGAALICAVVVIAKVAAFD